MIPPMALFTFRIGLSSSRPPREDMESFATIMEEDSLSGMLRAEQTAIHMALGLNHAEMPTSSTLLSAEI